MTLRHFACIHVTWLIHITRVTWLLYMCDMTLRVIPIWLIHMCKMTSSYHTWEILFEMRLIRNVTYSYVSHCEWYFITFWMMTRYHLQCDTYEWVTLPMNLCNCTVRYIRVTSHVWYGWVMSHVYMQSAWESWMPRRWISAMTHPCHTCDMTRMCNITPLYHLKLKSFVFNTIAVTWDVLNKHISFTGLFYQFFSICVSLFFEIVFTPL